MFLQFHPGGRGGVLCTKLGSICIDQFNGVFGYGSAARLPAAFCPGLPLPPDDLCLIQPRGVFCGSSPSSTNCR